MKKKIKKLSLKELIPLSRVDVRVQETLRNRLLLLVSSIPLFAFVSLFLSLRQLLPIVLILVLIKVIEQIYVIRSFAKDNVSYLQGQCVDIDSRQYNVRFYGLVYGKCHMFIQANGLTYEIPIPHNSTYQLGSIVNVWHNGSAYKKNGNMYSIPNPYFVTLEKTSVDLDFTYDTTSQNADQNADM